MSNFPEAAQDLSPSILTQESVLLVTTQRQGHDDRGLGMGTLAHAHTHTRQRQRESRLSLSPA